MNEPQPTRGQPRLTTCTAILVAVCAAAFLPAIDWGLPAFNSWSQDSIEGPNRMFVVEGWPRDWRGRYPPLHYLINAALYRGIESWWSWRGQLHIDPETGLKVLAAPQLPKLGFLILASRLLTSAMAVGTGLAVLAAAARLTGDRLAALLAALMLVCGADFAYFARLGNVDVPSIFWLAVAAYFYSRLLVSRRTADAVMLALAGTAAVCTKDGAAGVLPGMALVLVVAEAAQRRREQQPSAGWTPGLIARAIASPRWWVGLAAFLAAVLFINGAFHNPERFVARMRYWLDASGETLHAQQPRYDNPLTLLLVSLRYAGGAVGWPMLAALVAGGAWAVFRAPRVAVLAGLPALTYYILVIQVGLRFTYSRFLFPMILLAAIPAGLAAARFLRAASIPRVLKVAATAAVVLPTVGYTACVSLEMASDGRYDAESWLDRNVPPGSTVGVFSKPQYLPRLLERGYDVRDLEMTPGAVDAAGCGLLILTSYASDGYDAAQRACEDALIGGQGDYRVAARFGGWRYLGTGRSWLGLAGWGAEPPGKISPRLTILTRADR